jgi:lactate dehydrogenase-like 2-hydroxyacid dehydrogenase
MSDKIYKKIVVLDSVILYPEHRERLSHIADSIVEYNTCLNINEVIERCKGADCVISCWVNIPNEVIDNNSQLKTIAFWTHDYEHRINREYAISRGIHVPAIPDYGTDSVAELVFIALLQLAKNPNLINNDVLAFSEEIVARFSDDVRHFNENVKDALSGKWIHEYVKTGRLKITNPSEIKEETLKGLTLGVLGIKNITTEISRIARRGFGMNTIYSFTDTEHDFNNAFRPVDQLLSESHVLVYDSRNLPHTIIANLDRVNFLSKIDVANLVVRRNALIGKTLGIVGLGRIGSRVAEIAVDGFRMKVQYFSRTRKPELEERLKIRFVKLDDLLASSEILSFHLPHHGAEGFLDTSRIRAIPAGTTVINASVGNIINDEEIFLSRFEEGDLKGYLDVFQGLPPRAALRLRRNSLLATYRLGWRTKSTVGLKSHKLISKLLDVTPN